MMQKDVHFYLTYALATKAGIGGPLAEKIAWADQFVDDLTAAELHGIQTQSASTLSGNWSDKQIQLTVLSVFHFVPGNSRKHPWMTTKNSPRAKGLVSAAMETDDPFRLGIALHALQDTFSHENFSGWHEDLNDCYPWYYPSSSLPNIGHAEMMATPDVVNYVWTDPRSGEQIDNKKRTLDAAKETYATLLAFSTSTGGAPGWDTVKAELIPLFKLKSYDDRVTGICKISKNPKVHYDTVDKKLNKKRTRSAFVQAANLHLAEALRSFAGLPWLS